MTLTGKGFFIWKIKDCQGGNAEQIASEAYNAGFSHVLIKIADGAYAYNWDTVNNVDRIPPVVAALRKYGIKVWGWHYVYGYNPVSEANKAISQVNKYNLDGYVIDAEGEFKQTGMDAVAKTFLSTLRTGLPNFPVALCSYRWPSYHPQFPWKTFLEKCDLNMPMVYWMGAHNAGAQLKRCVQEFQTMTPIRPIIPVGPAFSEAGWTPTVADEVDFFNTVVALGLPAFNFFSWDECRRSLPDVWNAIAQMKMPGTTSDDGRWPQLLIEAYNCPNNSLFVKLYDFNAIMVLAKKTIRTMPNILTYFAGFRSSFPNSRYTLTGFTKHDNAFTLTWTAISSNNRKINDGKDTIGIRDGKVVYHYRSYTIS